MYFFANYFKEKNYFDRISTKNAEKVINKICQKKDGLAIDRESASIYIKIILNYIQMMAILSSFDFNWSNHSKNFLNGVSSLGIDFLNNMISFKCLAISYEITTNSFYIQTFLVTILPFLVIFISWLILIIFSFWKQKSQKIRFYIIVIIVCVLFQSPIVKILLENTSCINIENISYLKKDTEIFCDSDSHKFWVFYFILFIFK